MYDAKSASSRYSSYRKQRGDDRPEQVGVPTGERPRSDGVDHAAQFGVFVVDFLRPVIRWPWSQTLRPPSARTGRSSPGRPDPGSRRSPRPGCRPSARRSRRISCCRSPMLPCPPSKSARRRRPPDRSVRRGDVEVGREHDRSRPRTSGSVLTTSATPWIKRMISLAIGSPGAALAPNRKVRGTRSRAGSDFICWYSQMMCRVFSNWRLYSCNRLTMTSSRECGSNHNRRDAAACGQMPFVVLLDQPPILLERRFVRVGFQFAEPLEVVQPPVADLRGDQIAELRIGQTQEAARRDAVGLVLEPLGPHLGEIAQRPLAQQPRLQFGNAVDGRAAHRAQVGHPDLALRAFLDQRHPGHPGFVARKTRRTSSRNRRLIS
jgi:hypothetical protein